MSAMNARKQFFVRAFNRDLTGPVEWCVEQSGKRGWEAIVALFDEKADAALACAGLNAGELTVADLPPVWLRNHQSRRPTLGERMKVVLEQLDEAGIEHERIGGGPLSFGFRPNR